MISYKGIITYFEAICDAHQQINAFTYGEIDLKDTDKFKMYPALHLTPTGTAIDDQTITYGFDVIVYDRYNVASNKMRNEATCLSDALLILQDICKEITDGKYFINENTLISMDTPVICQPFIDTEPDNCSGWFTSFNVVTPNESSACNIPYYQQEQISYNDWIVPPALSDEPNGFAWYSFENIQNVMGLTGGSIDTLAPLVDTMSGEDTLDMAGTGANIDLLKRAYHFNDQSPSSVSYLGRVGLDSSVYTFFITIKDFSRFGGSDNAGNHSNNIMGIKDADGDQFLISFSHSSGKLYLSRVDGVTKGSTIPLVPTDGDSYKTAPRRKEPLTLAIVFSANETYTKLYWSNSVSEVIESETDGFDMRFGGEFFVGNNVATSYSDFYLKELLVVKSAMSLVDIRNIMEWLNYR